MTISKASKCLAWPRLPWLAGRSWDSELRNAAGRVRFGCPDYHAALAGGGVGSGWPRSSFQPFRAGPGRRGRTRRPTKIPSWETKLTQLRPMAGRAGRAERPGRCEACAHRNGKLSFFFFTAYFLPSHAACHGLFPKHPPRSTTSQTGRAPSAMARHVMASRPPRGHELRGTSRPERRSSLSALCSVHVTSRRVGRGERVRRCDHAVACGLGVPMDVRTSDWRGHGRQADSGGRPTTGGIVGRSAVPQPCRRKNKAPRDNRAHRHPGSTSPATGFAAVLFYSPTAGAAFPAIGVRLVEDLYICPGQVAHRRGTQHQATQRLGRYLSMPGSILARNIRSRIRIAV